METRSNPVLTLDEDAYVEQLLAGLGAYPTYYAQMAPVNRAGPAPVDLSPPVVADVEQLRRRLAAGEWVVDLRPGRAFAHGHAAGTVSVGLDGNLATVPRSDDCHKACTIAEHRFAATVRNDHPPGALMGAAASACRCASTSRWPRRAPFAPVKTHDRQPPAAQDPTPAGSNC